MAQKIREVMTADPIALPADAALHEAARAMRDNGIGDVLVTNGGMLHGLVTDRDLVVRGLAEGDATRTIGPISTRDLMTVSPDDDVEQAVSLMSERAIRRVPVVEEGRVVGVVTLGDIAIQLDPASALADISAAPANQ